MSQLESVDPTASSQRTPIEASGKSAGGRLCSILFVCAMFAVLVQRTSTTIVDPDLWHEMALGREVMELGRVPWDDHFSYVPTVYPCVHHEWGTGLIAYALSSVFGESGILLIKYILVVGIAVICWKAARAGGVSIPVLASFSYPAILMADYAFSPIRAQMFSFLFTALLCYFIFMDQRGVHRWIIAWIPVYIFWVNMHAGFLVGAGLFFFYWLEQFLRGKDHRHLLAAGIVMVPLMIANPYGFHYLSYLLRAVPMDRPLISEWGSLWQSGDPHHVVAYVLAVTLYLVSLFRVGWRFYVGFSLVGITAIYSLMHMRMLGLFAITWICFVPSHFESSRFAVTIKKTLASQRIGWAAIWAGAICAVGAAIAMARPLDLLVPGHHRIGQRTFHTYYPVGPVRYMQTQGFHGNLIVPFDFGAYVLWKMAGQVYVSIDSRYEVAYPDGSLETNYRLYSTAEDALVIIQGIESTDAVLVPQWSPLARVMHTDPVLRDSWELVFQDDDFQLFVRTEIAGKLTKQDSRKKVFWGHVP